MISMLMEMVYGGGLPGVSARRRAWAAAICGVKAAPNAAVAPIHSRRFRRLLKAVSFGKMLAKIGAEHQPRRVVSENTSQLSLQG